MINDSFQKHLQLQVRRMTESPLFGDYDFVRMAKNLRPDNDTRNAQMQLMFDAKTLSSLYYKWDIPNIYRVIFLLLRRDRNGDIIIETIPERIMELDDQKTKKAKIVTKFTAFVHLITASILSYHTTQSCNNEIWPWPDREYVIIPFRLEDKAIYEDGVFALVYCREEHDDTIAIPDCTFKHSVISASPGSAKWGNPEGPNWKEIIQNASELESLKLPLYQRPNVSFFRGACSHPLRYELAKSLQIGSIDPKIVPIFNFSLTDGDLATFAYQFISVFDAAPNHRVLLDLPGRGPWSVRTKELLLSRSSIIRVVVRHIPVHISDDENQVTTGDRLPSIHKSFIDYVMNPRDFHQIVLNQFYLDNLTSRKNLQMKKLMIQELSQYEIKKTEKRIYAMIIKLLQDNSIQEQNRVIQTYERVSQLTDDRIFQFMFRCLDAFASIPKKITKKELDKIRNIVINHGYIPPVIASFLRGSKKQMNRYSAYRISKTGLHKTFLYFKY